MQAFVPKNRRARFELGLRIIDLNNVPLVNGTAFVKWRLPSSSGAEHHGNTDKAVIIDHRAYWNYEKTLPVRLTIDRNQALHECEIHFEVTQEFEAGHGDIKNFLGRIRLNLAEYVDKSDEDEGIVRRYLMQDSKVNSTLKVGISMRQVEGDRNYVTPPLKSAMVFGGITGVVSSEQTDPDDLGPLPSMNTQSRETSDLQDMYRRTLAASWNSRCDEIPADKLVEDLFAGTISWSCDTQEPRSSATGESGLFPTTSASSKHTSSNMLSPSFERRPRSPSNNQFRSDGKLHNFGPSVGHSRKKGSIDQQLYGSMKGTAWKNRNNDRELSEFDVREDLRSWEIEKCSSPSIFRLRDGLVRYQHTDGEPENPPPETPQDTPETSCEDEEHEIKRFHNPRQNVRGQKKYKKISTTFSTLGQPGDIVVLTGEPQRQQLPESPYEKPKNKLPSMIKDVEESREEVLKDSLVNRRIDDFRAPYQPRDNISLPEWDKLRSTIQFSFTGKQLLEYLSVHKGDASEHDKTTVLEGGVQFAPWKPGTSAFFETGLASKERISDRIVKAKGLKGKERMVEKILRDCWQLGIDGEVGQLDIHLPSRSLHLLLYSDYFSFEELAELHEAKIDITQSLGLVRITGKQHACRNIGEMVHDATTRIREEELDIYVPDGVRAKVKNSLFSADFMSWISMTYKIVFEQDDKGPTKMFYLNENKPNVDAMLRTLNLAIYDMKKPSIPFGTYLSSSEPIDTYDIDPESNVPWLETQKAWFRWAAPSTQAAVHRVQETPFFDNHETRLSDELLKLLREPSQTNKLQAGSAEVHESVTAAVGRCLFLRKPFSGVQAITASQLGKVSPPRTFTTDIPRVMPFLQKLSTNLHEKSMQPHRIHLVPSPRYAAAFPPLEVELAVSPFRANPECHIQSVKAVYTDSKVDYLLPECGLDLRFSRKLTTDLLTDPLGDTALDPFKSFLQELFVKAITREGGMPVPSSTQITLPTYAVKRTKKAHDTDGSTTAEYMFLPVSELRGMRVNRFGFQDQRLNYAFYESGPYYAQRTTDLYLDMDLTEKNPFLMAAEKDEHEVTLKLLFNSFYRSACSLAFELDRAGRVV
ncbi:mitochondrial inner-membrane-bound regulator-domain-containing protein [Aspergillus avenaceus]|uniref:Mitochondrial inner-membrane-bound regulator-domain-containing protein n=1 Tax=Aspergillus avenaceus TaxID=36643 RepID=A0A5N6TJH0_ASPAV|nr:mitochondrial inner-membrane-bound regulator-domain-containing protein [Aspergillus avenaceus]